MFCIFFHETVSQALYGIYLTDINLEDSREMIPVILASMLCSSSFYSFINSFLCKFVFNDIPYLAKLCHRKVMTRSGKDVMQICLFHFGT